MPIFTDTYLQRVIDEAELIISTEVPCIFKRFSMAVTAGTATYSLSKKILKIHQIMWKGIQMDNYELPDYQGDSWFKPVNTGVQGLPSRYSRMGSGFDKIMFYPIPNESITANDAIIDTDVGILSKVILCVDMSADTTSTTASDRLPTYLFRNIMKFYAMEQAYAKDGSQQNLQAAKYFGDKYLMFLAAYKKIINKIPQAVTVQFGEPGDLMGMNKLPARPVLPTTGNWSF